MSTSVLTMVEQCYLLRKLYITPHTFGKRSWLLLLATRFHHSHSSEAPLFGPNSRMVFGWTAWVSPRTFWILFHQIGQRGLSTNRGSVRLPERWKSQGEVSRNYERREEYKLGKVFLLILGGSWYSSWYHHRLRVHFKLAEYVGGKSA